jgi:membrane fusion protein (multidrug efflux system)
MEQANNAGSEAGGNGSRRKALIVIVTVFVVIGAAWFAWWWLVLSRRESTTDAYVAGNQVAVSAQVAGTVVSLLADDTQRVEAGQELLRLDATDAQLQLQRLAAVLAQAVRSARQQSATASQFEALVEQRRAELQGAEAQLARRQPLVASQAVSAEEVKQASVAVESARAALLAAQRQAVSAHVMTADLKPEEQPSVAEVRSQYEQAWVAAHRQRVLAPVSGYVARRTVQAGQHVQPGEALLSIVPLQSVWVDANFKEPQLRTLRLGQRAEVRADVYGNDVVYAGRVSGVAAGTGSAFSLLPAQNASGNWVKVVQRVPVRIELDASQLAKFPLRLGLSTSVRVDTTDRSGALLPSEAVHAQVAGTTLYDADAKAASAAAAAILQGKQPVAP